MSKIKCYIFHKNGHFASQCPQRRKGKGKSQTVVVTTEALLSECASKFENNFSFVSCLSICTTPNSAWYLDGGTSCDMTEARELFNSLSEEDSELHIELGNNAKYLIQRHSCYPRYLGITRRSCLEAHMVLDMEYREQERLEHGPGGPIFLLLSQLCPVSSTSFHHYRPGLASERTLAP
jgi:hypothetical protein